MLAMSLTLSPMRSQDMDPMATDASPMATNLTPTVEQEEGEDGLKEMDPDQRYEKPPPLHTGADWKIVLHLPEIETWLRMTSERVRDLTYSVQQDSDSRHVDVHLVQLKDICEDISDHVEQIHALLETEFSLKLLSYSVNVIVDIHTVQLLWHQLRVSVLVLRERILQGLQDANGNYTRQTDILQAFSEETKEDRLDSLTEVDDSGQLTIKCSQNYLSLDCGITAFELSDYSPSEDLLGALGDMAAGQAKPKSFDSWSYREMEKDFPELMRSVGLLTVAGDALLPPGSGAVDEDVMHSTPPAEDEGQMEGSRAPPPVKELPPDSSPPGPAGPDPPTVSQPTVEPVKPEGPKPQQLPTCESATPKRPIRDCFNYNEDSPTQPSRPKRGLFLQQEAFPGGGDGRALNPPGTLSKPALSRSTPSLLDPPDRSKLCLDLQASYPSGLAAVSQSYECLHRTGDGAPERPSRGPSKENSASLSRLSERSRKEKLRHKKVPEAPKGVFCRSSRGELVPAPNQPVQSRGNLAGKQGSTPCTPKSREKPRARAASPTAGGPGAQGTPQAELQSQAEPPGSPPSIQDRASPPGSTPTLSPPPKDKNKKSYFSSPSHVTRNGSVVEAWYGSDEYLALPSHLKQTEVLALKLENLTKLLPQKPRGETIQNIDDWELSEMNSDSELYPTYQVRKKHKRFGRASPSSSSDAASSLEESVESGPLSEILSDEELFGPVLAIKKWTVERSEGNAITEKNESAAAKSAIIQQLMQDIQHQENYEAIWEKIEGFVNKLDEFIQWLNEAMETTENWTPPKAETDGLKLYLETHLSFKLNVDSHCALKEAVVEEGQQLLELIVSHKSAGLKDMLQMIASQWKELQRQINGNNSWILREEEGKEVQLCYLEAQRDAVEQMSLKLYSEQYASSSKRKEEFADMSKVHTAGSTGLLDFDSEYQELWDWLIDMESIVMDSHDLLMSEEQQQHLYKQYSVEMSIRHPKKMELLSKVEALKKGGVLLPNDLLEKVDSINEKWELLAKTLGKKIQDTMVGHSGLGPRDLLSPESGSLVRQLEVRIKELKGWLRDTELFIFNSCLRQEKEGTMNAEKQLQYFKSLCGEIKQRRRGVASVLRLCQHLLDDQETCNLSADHQSMQLIIVNLERRWEAIVMQAVQWQTRLQRKLGNGPEILNVIEQGLVDLNGANEDALEWDETDIGNKLISIHEDANGLDQEQNPAMPNMKPESEDPDREERSYEGYAEEPGRARYSPSIPGPTSPQIYQVYSLHNIELYDENHMTFRQTSPKFPGLTHPMALTKSLSNDSSFSSTKSLPDLLGGIPLVKPGLSRGGDISLHSGSESGIVSEGDPETTTNSEVCLVKDRDGTQSNPETGHPAPQMKEVVNALRQKLKDEEGHIPLSKNYQSPPSPVSCINGKDGDLNSVTKSSSVCLEDELRGKPDVLTFHDYSYLQGPKLKFPVIAKQSQSERVHAEETLLHGLHCDKTPCKSKQVIEPQPDKSPHELTLASAAPETDPGSSKSEDGGKASAGMQTGKQPSFLSCSSSLESLSPGGNMFGLGIFKNGECLQRSISLESWLTSYKSNEDLFSPHSSGDVSVSSGSVGELSKRTLDLLNRLENIQSPSEQKIKRSISDITLQSSSQKMSFTGHSLDIASSVNGDSAASLTELSSSDELSLCAEDIVLHRNKLPDSNASFRKRLTRSVADESDVNVSMIVNVSCTSACTDDEDDSDLLSSSTLTLTEEELGLKDEDDSSIATDDDLYEECNIISGLDYIKNELQTWMRPKFSLTREKRKCNHSDEIQSGRDINGGETLNPTDMLNIEALLNGSVELSENNGNDGKNVSNTQELGTKDQNKKNSSKVEKDPLVDDMENGNVESVPAGKKEEVGRMSTMAENCDPVGKKAPESEWCVCEAFTDSSDDSNMDGKEIVSSPKASRSPPKQLLNHLSPDDPNVAFSLTGNPGPESTPENRVMEVPDSTFLASSPVSEQSIAEKTNCFLALKPNEADKSPAEEGLTSCCNCMPGVMDEKGAKDCSVHSFVKEIIDLASTALKNKTQPENEAASPTSLAQIKEKVLEHSHRPIHLRKGDFYSYLSLSSHDSDCGEVTNYVEEKSNTPLPLDFSESGLEDKEDVECFFEACTEDDINEKESPFTQIPSNETPGPGKEPISPEILTSSSNRVDLSSSSDHTGKAGSKPVPQKVPTLPTELGGEPQISDHCEESSNPSSSKPSSGKGRSGNLDGIDMPRGMGVALAKTSSPDLPVKPEELMDQAELHPNAKTLTCEENLLNLHQERHINMHR
uniref:A-kinase anchoring protein 6 n=2 Tax=Ornithorhynchus anatinus TaxID=9258 RepID=F6Q8W7_ORNAN